MPTRKEQIEELERRVTDNEHHMKSLFAMLQKQVAINIATAGEIEKLRAHGPKIILPGDLTQ
jgi:hypothetical protein